MFAVARLLSFWADLLSFLLVVYLLSFRRNFAYLVVPAVEVSFENLDIVFGVILKSVSFFVVRVNPLFVRRKDDDENYNVVEKIENSRNFLARLEGEENRSAEN